MSILAIFPPVFALFDLVQGFVPVAAPDLVYTVDIAPVELALLAGYVEGMSQNLLFLLWEAHSPAAILALFLYSDAVKHLAFVVLVRLLPREELFPKRERDLLELLSQGLGIAEVGRDVVLDIPEERVGGLPTLFLRLLGRPLQGRNRQHFVDAWLSFGSGDELQQSVVHQLLTGSGGGMSGADVHHLHYASVVQLECFRPVQAVRRVHELVP